MGVLYSKDHYKEVHLSSSFVFIWCDYVISRFCVCVCVLQLTPRHMLVMVSTSMTSHLHQRVGPTSIKHWLTLFFFLCFMFLHSPGVSSLLSGGWSCVCVCVCACSSLYDQVLFQSLGVAIDIIKSSVHLRPYMLVKTIDF